MDWDNCIEFKNSDGLITSREVCSNVCGAPFPSLPKQFVITGHSNGVRLTEIFNGIGAVHVDLTSI